MKKIFGLFAAAALAATGLTCCGGGGGDGLSGKTYHFNNIPALMAGHMELTVNDIIVKGSKTGTMYNAEVSFGKEFYQGTVEVVPSEEGADVQFLIHAFGGQEIGQDTALWEFFSYFLPDDLEEGDTVTGFPAPIIRLYYNEGRNNAGQYQLGFYMVKEDENNPNPAPQADDGEEGDGGNNKVSFDDLEFELEFFTEKGSFYLKN